MTMPQNSLIAGLSAQERLSLIEALWDSLSEADLPLSDVQRGELDRRLARFGVDRADAVSWETLKAELRGRDS